MLMKLPVQVLGSRLAATTPHRFGAHRIKSVLSRDDVTAIRAYLIQRANEDKTPASPSRSAEGTH